MGNDGKPLEKTIQLIEETFKDSPNTQIFRNYKIKNSKGKKREIDVFIKTNINEYNICIAIECKDYKTKVTAEKIEAFNSKCSMIKEINKMIFVSTNGFQSGAMASAEYFGIELMTAEQLNSEYLESLMPPVKQLNLHILPHFDKPILTFDVDNSQIEELQSNFKGALIDGNKNKSITVETILSQIISNNNNFIQNTALLVYAKTHKISGIETIIPIPLKADFSKMNFYLRNSEGNKIKLIEFKFTVEIEFKYQEIQTSGRVLKSSDNSIKAYSVNTKQNENSETELIIKPNNDFKIFLTQNNETIQLETLLKLDPETNEFIKI